MQWTRSANTILLVTSLFGLLLSGCATTESSDPWADSGPVGPAPGSTSGQRPGTQAAQGSRGNETPAPTETTRPSGKVDWVAVFESPPGAKYNDQRVIYVDRNSVQPQPLENLTYYLARTREVTRAGAKAKIQEIAVLCEGAPIAPATSLRGEGTEESGGSYSLTRALTPLTSLSQFSTQRLRIDANNPNTFIVRAVCMLGTGG